MMQEKIEKNSHHVRKQNEAINKYKT